MRSICTQLASIIEPIDREFTIEVFFHIIPPDSEVAELLPQLEALCGQDGTIRQDIGDLTILLLNTGQPGNVVPDLPEGEERRPCIGTTRVVVKKWAPASQIAVRIPVDDRRAAEFLRREARQLPIDAPGLVMLQTTEATGACRTWDKQLRARFALEVQVPGQSTRE